MDVVSSSTTDWRHPELPAKPADLDQTSGNIEGIAAYAAAGATHADGALGDLQPTAHPDTLEGRPPRSADTDDLTEQMGADPQIQAGSANAPAVLDDVSTTDEPGSSNTLGEPATQTGEGPQDVLPSGQQIMLILVGLVASGKVCQGPLSRILRP